MAQAKHASITRRAILSGGAALVAAALPIAPIAAPAATQAAASIPGPLPDPILAAIAAHVRAYDAFNGILDDLAVAEYAAWHAPRGARRAANRLLKQAYAAEAHFGDLEAEAVERFIATVPQSLHGVAAALRYVRERHDEGYPLWDDEHAMTFIATIERAVCRAAGLPAP